LSVARLPALLLTGAPVLCMGAIPLSVVGNVALPNPNARTPDGDAFGPALAVGDFNDDGIDDLAVADRSMQAVPSRIPSSPRNPMSLSMYEASVPVFTQLLTALDANLAKAAAHVTDKKIEPDALLRARLFPDMFELVRQVQIACDFAKSVPARLAGVEVPSYEDNESTFADLHARIAKTLAFVGSLDAAKLEGSEEREIVLRPGTPKEKRLGGKAYLLGYGLPQFFFHVTTAYALLRHNGVEIGKKDFMGSY
jgi:hypothetical protein